MKKGYVIACLVFLVMGAAAMSGCISDPTTTDLAKVKKNVDYHEFLEDFGSYQPLELTRTHWIITDMITYIETDNEQYNEMYDREVVVVQFESEPNGPAFFTTPFNFEVNDTITWEMYADSEEGWVGWDKGIFVSSMVSKV